MLLDIYSDEEAIHKQICFYSLLSRVAVIQVVKQLSRDCCVSGLISSSSSSDIEVSLSKTLNPKLLIVCVNVRFKLLWIKMSAKCKFFSSISPLPVLMQTSFICHAFMLKLSNMLFLAPYS